MSSPHIGSRELAHRVVMVPLTRMRAGPGMFLMHLPLKPRRLRKVRVACLAQKLNSITCYGGNSIVRVAGKVATTT
jgi:hypothetical protein